MALRYQEVKENVRNTVLGLKAGSKIPSRVFLSRKYQAARNTIDKAISELEKEGYLYSVKGSGTFVSESGAKKVLNIGVILPSIVDDMYPQFISGIERYPGGRLYHDSCYKFRIKLQHICAVSKNKNSIRNMQPEHRWPGYSFYQHKQ